MYVVKLRLATYRGGRFGARPHVVDEGVEDVRDVLHSRDVQNLKCRKKGKLKIKALLRFESHFFAHSQIKTSSPQTPVTLWQRGTSSRNLGATLYPKP